MAHSPASRPEPLEPQQPERAFASNEEHAEDARSGRSLSQYVSALSASGGGSLSAEVALDLVLNEIAERACQATKASGAAIALARDGEMVCRATTSHNAPDIGSRLSTSHGLSGACVRTGEWQLCDDTEGDSRVDGEVCRRLGVRSILVVPVRQAEALIGVVEIFSAQPKAFTDRDIQIMQAFAGEISDNVDRAAKLKVPKAEPCLILDSTDFQGSESATPPTGSAPKPSEKDFLTTALLVCVITLALILGWMVGRAEWRPPAPKSVASASQAAQSQSEAVPSDSSSPAATAPQTFENSAAARRTSNAAAEDSAGDDGLVVSRDGKVIFRSPSQGSDDASASTVQPAEQHTSQTPRFRIPPDIAQEYLARRVEPEYPEQARKRRIQGSVVVDAWVDKNGAVRRVTPVSGDSELVPAATHAVEKWQFQPFFHDGQPEEFTTRVTVNFRLP